jgi:hypothetical protein
MFILHPFCRVVDVKADPTLKLASVHKFDSIWVVIDWLTKSTHFIPVHTKYQVQKYDEIFIARMLCLQRVSKKIVFDWGWQFVARFWEQLYASLGTHLIHSLAYHPQTDGQIEKVNKILEDMFRACVMEYPDSWNKNLS